MSAGVGRGRDGSRHGLDREAGFTLLEIVVALVVLGILLVTLTRGVQFGLAAYDRQDGMVATAGRLEAVDRTLRRLITLLDPGTPFAEDLQEALWAMPRDRPHRDNRHGASGLGRTPVALGVVALSIGAAVGLMSGPVPRSSGNCMLSPASPRVG